MAIIFDVDNTLALTRGLGYLIREDRGDFGRWRQAVGFALPIEETVSLARSMPEEEVVILTARDDHAREVTEDWLAKHGIRYAAIYNRAAGDNRSDAKVKRDLLATIRADGFEIEGAYDDKPAVARMLEGEGIPVTLIEA